MRKRAVMTRMQLGEGFQPNMGLGKDRGEFWAGSSGFAENRVDSRGWRPSMARNWAGLTQFGADFGVRKLKMLIFEGEDAYGWVYREERYFAINGLSEGEKLMAAALCLEGKTLMWFQWREQQPLRPWGEFKDRLLERFRGPLKREICTNNFLS